MAYEMTLYKVDDQEIFVREEGKQGRQVALLIHGWSSSWYALSPLLPLLSKRRHCLAVDLPGYGQSPPGPEPASIAGYADLLAGLIREVTDRPVLLVGHSMGGRHALFCAACVPNKVDRLILVDARPDTDPQASHALRRLLATFPLEAHSLKEVVEAIQSLYPYLPRDVCYHIARHGYKGVHEGTYIPKYDTRMSQQSDDTGYATEDLWPFMENVPCPVLLLRGKKSPFLSIEIAQQMCKALPQTKFKEIPKSTHLPVQENFIATTKVVADFLKN